MNQIQEGLRQLDSARNQAEDQFHVAQATLESNRLELEQAQTELDENRQQLDAGKAQLDAARKELEAGRKTYEENRNKAESELKAAEEDLEDARQQLEDGRRTLADMTEPDTYLLDRNTNVAYVCYESDADIVEGISRVFPLFFFLVAALVCITTMSKMVDEERTQIGVMKALGYGSGAITAKYLAIRQRLPPGMCAGCVGRVGHFPSAIWQGYSIMYNFASRIQLTFQWPLCAIIVCSFTGCMLAVTWFCCRRGWRRSRRS